MVGHDGHQQKSLLAYMQEVNNKQQTKEITMENNNPTYEQLFEQLQTAQRDLADTKVMMERVNSIGERNAHRLREALKTARQLLVDAREIDDSFIKDHYDEVRQLVSFGMDDFTKKVNVFMQWTVTLTVEAEVPEDYDEDTIDIYMKDDVDDIIGGSFGEDSDVLDGDWELNVECRTMEVEVK